MPSYFFHIAFDLVTAPATATSFDSSWETFPIKESHQFGKDTCPILTSSRLSDATVQSHSNQTRSNAGRGVLEGQEIRTRLSHRPATAGDWRYGRVLTQGVKMESTVEKRKRDTSATNTSTSNGIGVGLAGAATKGRFEPLSTEEEELGWGVVRLYRDGEETPGLYDEPPPTKGSKASRVLQRHDEGDQPAFKDEECTTLCILAVPSYLTPSDFLGFVGEKTRDEVSHFRMIRTERNNRYMVLMKFRNGKKAREWRKEWNGKAFDSMEVIVPFSYFQGR